MAPCPNHWPCCPCPHDRHDEGNWDAVVTVNRYVIRLIDYGKGADDPEFDDLTIGQIADRIITAAKEA